MLLKHPPVEVDDVPGDHRIFETEMARFTPEKLGETKSYLYEFGEFDYSPPDDCVQIEKAVEELFESRSLDVTKPYSEPDFWTYAVGPTVILKSSQGKLTTAFHGDRPESPGYERDSPGKKEELAHPGRWSRWLAGITGNERVTAVKVSEETIQNILTPRLLYSLLQLEPETGES